MKNRVFPKINLEVSPFSMGCMRLPNNHQDGKWVIDQKQVTEMVRYAIDHGVNYFDSAHFYHDGLSEGSLGTALAGGYRDRAIVTTKLPTWNVQEPADMDRLLDEQLGRLGTDHVDFYLMHDLKWSTWQRLEPMGLVDFIEKIKRQGKARFVGFSVHDNVENIKKVLDVYDWQLMQAQFNYLDVFNQAGIEGIRYAGQKGVGVVVMEGLLGGRLLQLPAEVKRILDESPYKRSLLDWAFRFIADFPEVVTVLSGVSNMQQLKEDIAIFEDYVPNMMSQAEKDLLDQVRLAMEARVAVPCTRCGYCLPCPQGVAIPDNFGTLNEYYRYDNVDNIRWWYGQLQQQGKGAIQCTACGECVSKCPQNIPIPEKMTDFAAFMKDKI